MIINIANSDGGPRHAPASRWTTAACAALVVGVTLLFHPYWGIWHDSVLYLGQALALLYPESFRQDLFFAFGSQADYTLFPRAIAWLIERYGSGEVFRWLTLCGLVAFVAASWQLIRHLIPAHRPGGDRGPRRPAQSRGRGRERFHPPSS